MTQFYRLAMPIIALALSPACDSDRAKSDKAAENVVDKQHELDKSIDKQIDRNKDIGAKTAGVSKAIDSFDVKRELRMIELRSERAIMAAQSPMLSTMAGELPLTQISREQVLDKVRILDGDLIDVDAKLDDLKAATPTQWQQLDAAAADAMKKAEDARTDAWKALKDAKRTDRNAS